MLLWPAAADRDHATLLTSYRYIQFSSFSFSKGAFSLFANLMRNFPTLLQDFYLSFIRVCCLPRAEKRIYSSSKMAAQTESTARPAFDPLTTTATDLQASLQKGTLTSTEIVNVYIDQIAKYNDSLHAVLTTISPERLKTRISELDSERASGHIRGPLHGIPVLVKVSERW
jgi:hypothetical protein